MMDLILSLGWQIFLRYTTEMLRLVAEYSSYESFQLSTGRSNLGFNTYIIFA